MVRIPTLQSWRWHQVTRLLWIYLHHFQQLVKHTLQQLWRWGGKRWQKVSNVSSEGQHSGGSYQWQQRCVVSCTSLLGIAVRRMQCLSLNFQSDNTAELPPNKKICPVAVRVLFFFFVWSMSNGKDRNLSVPSTLSSAPCIINHTSAII